MTITKYFLSTLGRHSHQASPSHQPEVTVPEPPLFLKLVPSDIESGLIAQEQRVWICKCICLHSPAPHISRAPG